MQKDGFMSVNRLTHHEMSCRLVALLLQGTGKENQVASNTYDRMNDLEAVDWVDSHAKRWRLKAL